MTMRVLVTGASGLVGGKVVELLRRDAEPIALVRSTGTSLPAGVETIVADLTDPAFVTRLPPRIDAVIHLAQAPGFADYPASAQTVFQTNVAGLAGLLAWAAKAGARHFIHASTGGVYGRGPEPFCEDDPIQLSGQLAFYIGSKSAAELLAAAYDNAFNVAALRFFFVYGPGQRETMLIPRLMRAVTTGGPLTLAGQQGMRFNPIFVDDAAAAVMATLRLRESAVVNVAGMETVSIRAIGEIIGEIVGREPLFKETQEPEGNDIVADTTRMCSLLHQPVVGLREGLTCLADGAFGCTASERMSGAGRTRLSQ